jgi:hypothetical protein
MLVETWLDFPVAGKWQMGGNSDDGFSVKSGHAPGDVFGQLLGEQAWGESTFSFLVPQPGVYLSYILIDEFSDMMGCQRAGRLGRVFWRRISVPVTSVRPAVSFPQ